MPVINVNIPDEGYPVKLGSGVIEQLPKLINRATTGGRLFIFYDAQFYVLHRAYLKKNIKMPEHRLFEMVLPPGERAKSLTTAKKLYEVLLSEKINRSDLILACGGGVTTDLVGYTAATILRGIPWGAVPTTLTGMADAAIGGKTGVNHHLGKNLIGVFWQPQFVLCEIRFLATLPFRQLVCGLGEIVKYAGLTGGNMLAEMNAYLARGDFYDFNALTALIAMGIKYKAGLVAMDTRDNDRRRFLNFGHTFAHAFEKAAGYGRLLHGEAVILGVAAALETGYLLKPSLRKYFKPYQLLVNQMMQLVPSCRIRLTDVLNALAWDKKNVAGKNKYVLLSRPGKPFITEDPGREIIKKVLKKILLQYQSAGG